MMLKQYNYVGPSEIQAQLNSVPFSQPVDTAQSLLQQLHQLNNDLHESPFLTVTFVIDKEGNLRICDRHQEHVACARGRPVLSAGEMTFAYQNADYHLERITNQSTGYCPEPDSWQVVDSALKQLGIQYPDFFEPAYDFRRCPRCTQINLIKDNYYYCAVCETDLPAFWNCDQKG
ncbi:hypothetical protein [Gimesia algae]|nr:hypothetical protein [Gimesia algae]